MGNYPDPVETRPTTWDLHSILSDFQFRKHVFYRYALPNWKSIAKFLSYIKALRQSPPAADSVTLLPPLPPLQPDDILIIIIKPSSDACMLCRLKFSQSWGKLFPKNMCVTHSTKWLFFIAPLKSAELNDDWLMMIILQCGDGFCCCCCCSWCASVSYSFSFSLSSSNNLFTSPTHTPNQPPMYACML